MRFVDKEADIKESFLDGQLLAIRDKTASWYEDYVNFIVSGVMPPELSLDDCHASPYRGHHSGDKMTAKSVAVRVLLTYIIHGCTCFREKV